MREAPCNERRGEKWKQEVRSRWHNPSRSKRTKKQQKYKLCTIEQEAHNAATEASGTRPRPLLRHHRRYHLRMAPSRGTNRATRSSQTSRVHTHQMLAWSVFSSWDSDRRCVRPAHGIRWVRRGVQANAFESIAGRRVGQISKEAHDLQAPANSERTPHKHSSWRFRSGGARIAVRAARPERLVLATVNAKSLIPEDLSRSHKYGVNTNNTIDQIDRELNLHGRHVVGVKELCVQGNVTREQQEVVALTNVAQQNWPHPAPDLLAGLLADSRGGRASLSPSFCCPLVGPLKVPISLNDPGSSIVWVALQLVWKALVQSRAVSSTARACVAKPSPGCSSDSLEGTGLSRSIGTGR